MWFSVVCTLIDNEYASMRGQTICKPREFLEVLLPRALLAPRILRGHLFLAVYLPSRSTD